MNTLTKESYMNKCVIIGGGTFNHISCHLSLAAPAFGQTARDMVRWFPQITEDMECILTLTKMADHTSVLVTNQDVANYVAGLLADPLVKVIVLNAAICDFEIENPSEETRLSSKQDYPVVMKGITSKIIGGIKELRPDIVVCGFKTTHGATETEQFKKAVNSMNSNSLNLVLANDVATKENILISDSGNSYFDTRENLLKKLLSIAVSKVNVSSKS